MPGRSAALATMLLALALPVPAAAASGGAQAPTASGGLQYEAPSAAPRPIASTGGVTPRRSRPPVATRFTVPRRLVAGSPLAIAWRVDGRAPLARVRVDLLRAGERRPAYRIDLGRRPTGRSLSYSWAGGKDLLPGTYDVRLHAVDAQGLRLARGARSPGRERLLVVPTPQPEPPSPSPPAGALLPAPLPPPVTVALVDGRFPVAGTYDFGGDDARFGAGRPGHIHQGQDMTAALGTPVVAPRAGTIVWRAYQEGGAGYYLVLRDADGSRDYAFMHLREGSLLVRRGDPVAAGQQLAVVGSTGSSTGPHLHFEIWPGGWYAKGTAPVDPLPQLRRWAGLA